MSPKTVSIKVEAELDAIMSDAAHYKATTKKALYDEAVVEYIHNHREELHRAMREAQSRLDGSLAAEVGLLAGVSKEDVERLGGVGGVGE